MRFLAAVQGGDVGKWKHFFFFLSRYRLQTNSRRRRRYSAISYSHNIEDIINKAAHHHVTLNSPDDRKRQFHL